MAELVKETGGIPLVGDSSGVYGFTRQSLDMCGISQAAKKILLKRLKYES
ncbi:MAG: hypothetical protein LUQ20_01730 [Candidatus Methanoperedens sp.]|jgi:uncharacterized protein (DUF362 family)|nr:hypothetical protein [Candidatus Methanoperedens sp.]